MYPPPLYLNKVSKRKEIAFTFLILLGVGLGDFFTGQMNFALFYLIPISYASWRVGRGFAIFISLASVACLFYLSWLSGYDVHRGFVLAWNMASRTTFFITVVMLLSSIKAHRELEERARKRMESLCEEIAEREWLGKLTLEIGEREQRRIGHDLHDNLCQHLTCAAIAGKVASQKLATKGLLEAADVENVVGLVEEAITLVSDMARGLDPVIGNQIGMMDAFMELAATTQKRFGVECRFKNCDLTVAMDETVLTHLYRIAQEAIGNAVSHGHAQHVFITFSETSDQTILTIADDGCGLPSVPTVGKGMGLRVMKHRAALIGASFAAQRNPTSGTVVTCSLNKLQKTA